MLEHFGARGGLEQVNLRMEGIRPVIAVNENLAVWRRIEVPASYSFWDLHVAIQDAMGWLDYHLHAFRLRNPITGQVDQIGIPDEDAFEGDLPYLPGWQVPLVEYFRRAGDRAEYEYDFGDGWEHQIRVEGIIEDDKRYPGRPVCLEGARNCPPEDCGGPWGYQSFLKAIGDKKHKEHKEFLDWVGGGFDPEHFDLDEVNDLLRKIDLRPRW